jgi:mannosyltransferase
MSTVTVIPNAVSQEESAKIQLRRKSRMWDRITCGLLYLMAVFFHFYQLGSPSLWYDETWSVDIARQPFNIFWRIISSHDPNMSLYYILLRFWVQALGFIGIPVTEFWARFPSVFFSSLTSIVIFLLAKRFFGRFLGFVVTILFITNVELLPYVQQVRSYGLLIFLLSLSWYYLILLLSSHSVKKRWWFGYILSTALAFYAQLFLVFVIAAQLMALAGVACLPNQWRQNFWQRWKMLLLSLIVTAVLMIPEIWIAMRNVGKVDWLPRPIPSDLYHMFFFLTGNNKIYFLLAMTILGVGSLIVVVSKIFGWKPTLWQLLPNNSRIREPLQKILSQTEYLPLFWVFICWLVVPLLLSYIMSLGTSRYFSFRYLMVITPAFCFLVGLGLVLLLILSCIPLCNIFDFQQAKIASCLNAT